MSTDSFGAPRRESSVNGTVKDLEDEDDDKTVEEPGVALIKKEFLVRKPKPHEPDVKSSSPEILLDVVSSRNGGSDAPTDGVGNSTESIQGAEKRKADSGEAPAKKMKGQFKNRPVDKSARDPTVKLCNGALRGETCPMAGCERACVYMHDVDAFLASKPPDLGPNCYLFDSYGYCPQMLHCRFGEAHRQFDLDNVKTDGVNFGALEAKLTLNSNNLPKDLQIKLRKRKYEFKKADAAWKAVGKEMGKSGEIGRWLEKKKSNTDDSASPSHESPTRDACRLEPREDLVSDKSATDVPSSSLADATSMDRAPPATIASVGSVGPERKSKIRFADKLFLAPLTTVGNLPFRRICKELGADITCGEMAMSTNLLQGQSSEWALIKRHPCEDIFGVQLCGGFPDSMSRISQVLKEQMRVDFIDINMGCPIDLVYKKGQGSALMNRTNKLEQIVRSMKRVLTADDDYVPLSIKFRTGIQDGVNTAHTLIPKLKEWGVDLMTLHGRSRQQRYTRQADWNYIHECAQVAHPIPFFGNGDVYSVEEYNRHRSCTNVDGIMIARGALYKPWIFTEIKEQRDWDISSSERFDLLRKFSNYGLEHWGSDTQGVETTRKFLLEWLSFFYRYIPVGVLERVPHRLNERAPPYVGRNDLETLMASPAATDWVKISEMLLGPTPDAYQFLPKHKANAVATWTDVNL